MVTFRQVLSSPITSNTVSSLKFEPLARNPSSFSNCAPPTIPPPVINCFIPEKSDIPGFQRAKVPEYPAAMIVDLFALISMYDADWPVVRAPFGLSESVNQLPSQID